MAQNKILTEEEIVELRKPIAEYVGKIQTEIDAMEEAIMEAMETWEDLAAQLEEMDAALKK